MGRKVFSNRNSLSMRSLNRRNFRSFAPFLAAPFLVAGGFISAQDVRAQVVYSVGTQEVYDSNIFLEDDKALSTVPVDKDGNPFEQADGDLNSDFISNPYVSMAGRIPTGRKIVTNYNARLGFIVYNDNTDLNRATVDGTLAINPGEEVLPQYWTFGFYDTMSSQASAVGVAQGAASQQGQINVATISGGLSNYKFNEANSFTNVFAINRQDYLEQFNLSGSDDDRLTIPGVDSMSYGMNTRFDHSINSKWTAFLSNNLNYFDVTGGTFGDGGDNGASSGLDRVNISPSLGASYAANNRLQFSASTGVDFSKFSSSGDSNTSTNLNQDDSQSSFFYALTSSYTASERASVSLNVLQSAGTDVNGGRILSRSFGANGSYMFNNLLSGNLGVQYAQFTLGDTLSKPTDRVTVTAAAKYSITDTVALSAGYNYVVQNSERETTSLLFNNGDYAGHRVFVGLDTGFMGVIK